VAVEGVRRRVGEALTQSLAGDAAADRRRHLAAPAGSPTYWFGPERPIRQVHADASMLVGGIRALLLQTLHPLAMAGVAEHSTYRTDPLGRLHRTGLFLGMTTFGTADEAAAAVARVRGVHRRVRGTLPDGRTYSAGDPDLLRWVHVAEADSFLRAYQRYGRSPLDQEGRDGYVEDLALVGERLGVVDPPRSEAELRDQLDAFRPELQGSPVAREAARFVLLKPPLALAARPAYGVLAAAAVGLMPRWTRWPLRLPYFPLAEATLVRAAGEGVTRAVRWALAPADQPASA
jgi:uncharacterized protein (DUF2236 family)